MLTKTISFSRFTSYSIVYLGFPGNKKEFNSVVVAASYYMYTISAMSIVDSIPLRICEFHKLWLLSVVNKCLLSFRDTGYISRVDDV